MTNLRVCGWDRCQSRPIFNIKHRKAQNSAFLFSCREHVFSVMLSVVRRYGDEIYVRFIGGTAPFFGDHRLHCTGCRDCVYDSVW